MSLLNSSQLDYSFNNVKIHQPTLSELIEIFKVEEENSELKKEIGILRQIIFELSGLLTNK